MFNVKHLSEHVRSWREIKKKIINGKFINLFPHINVVPIGIINIPSHTHTCVSMRMVLYLYKCQFNFLVKDTK